MREPNKVLGGVNDRSKSINDISAQRRRIIAELDSQVDMAMWNRDFKRAKTLNKRRSNVEEAASRYRNNIANILEPGIVNWNPSVHEDFEYADDYETTVPVSQYTRNRRNRNNRR